MMGMRAKKICMAMLLIVGGIVAVFLAHRKVAEKITEEEYQRFLDGEVPAMKENGKTYFLEDLFGEDVSDVETFLSGSQVDRQHFFQFNRSNTRRAADRAEHLKLCRGNIQRRQILVKQTIFLLINHMD